MDQIKFGTHGWRARADRDFNEKNVLRVTHGIARYLKEKYEHGTVVVGFDSREFSRDFARTASRALNGFGFNVMITTAPTPTPVMSLAVIDNNAIAGIEVTASHNPWVYNGIKVLTAMGAPAPIEMTEKIEAHIPREEVKKTEGIANEFDPRETYFASLRQKLDLSRVKEMKAVVDSMHGAGAGYLSRFLLEAGAAVQELHGDYAFNPNLNPEPKEDNLQELRQAVLSTGAGIGIANDGDADRIGVFDENGMYYTGNMLGLIVADYLVKAKGMHGNIARTVSTTHALDRLCEKHGLGLVETPVGIRYLANELINGAILAVEESGGLGFGWHAPEKDGIMSGALMCEIIANSSKPLSEIWKEVASEYAYGEYLQVNVQKMQKLSMDLEMLKNEKSRTELAGREIIERLDIDGIKYLLDDGSWVLIRESNTEPLVRIYIEAKDKNSADELYLAVRRLIGL